MKIDCRLAAAAALALCVPAGLAAQNYRFDIGVNGGGSWLSSGMNEDQLGIDGDVMFDAGWLTGAQATLWFGERVGLRANFGYADRGLQFDPEDDLVNGDFDDVDLLDHVNLWTGTGDLLVRFAGTPAPEFQGPEFLPFIALGAGARWVNPAGPDIALVGTDDDATGAVFTVGDDAYFVEEKANLMGRVALGTDLRPTPLLGIRLEVGDMLWDAPFQRVEPSNGEFTPSEPVGEDVGVVQHELYATAGVHVLLGLTGRQQQVAALPAPPPPPPAPQPEPEPEPEPEPLEERLTLCVIDPSTDTGTRTLNAVYLPAAGDTLVDEMGQRITLDQYDAGVRVALDEEWYRMGQPLRVEYGTRSTEFIPYGTNRVIERDLVVIGTVDGLPVYADASAATAFRTAAGAAVTPDTNLEALLDDRTDLRDSFDQIDVVYVPAQPVGCVFGPLQRTEDVRKGGS